MFKCLPLKRKKTSRGFSLMEILVVIALSFVIFGALYGVYLISNKSYLKSAAKAEINQNGRISLERIARDLRQTISVNTVLPLTESDLLNPPPSTIMFQDGHDISRIQYIEYSLQGNELHRKLIHYCFSATPAECPPGTWVTWNATDPFGSPASNVDEDMIKADKITALKFFGNKVITVDLSIADTQNNSANFKTDVYCRNI